jgi:hypothetical protein
MARACPAAEPTVKLRPSNTIVPLEAWVSPIDPGGKVCELGEEPEHAASSAAPTTNDDT